MIRRWLLTGFALGYAPAASGTFGSAGAVAIAAGVWAVVHVNGVDGVWLDVAWIVLALSASAGCVHWGPWAVQYLGPGAKKPGDPSAVVLDEFAGQWLALVALPMTTPTQAGAVLAVQFFLFRLFDVLKLPPCRRFEKLPHGWGIVTDDLAAAVYANLVGQIVFRAFWVW